MVMLIYIEEAFKCGKLEIVNKTLSYLKFLLLISFQTIRMNCKVSM